MKASKSLTAVGSDYVFDLDIRDYNLWLAEESPVILVLFDASRRRANWVSIQEYFRDHPTRRPRKGAKWVRVRVPNRQTVSRRAIAAMRELKKRFRLRIAGGEV